MSQETNAASRFRRLLASERRSADLYSGLADAATGERQEVLTELAAVERKHAAHWAGKTYRSWRAGATQQAARSASLVLVPVGLFQVGDFVAPD
jgi:rubrerythrin